MDKDKLIQRLMATFLEELQEHVGSLNRDLLALEKNPENSEGLLKTLFRTAHSLKGAARSVNVNVIEGACHRLEAILEAARDGQLALHTEHFALLFATADALEEASMSLRERQDLTEAPLAALLPRLEAAVPSLPKTESAAPMLQPAPPSPQPTFPAKPVTYLHEPPPPSSIVPSAAAEVFHEHGAGGSSLRVSAEKLDTLLARIGELLVARRRVEARLQDLQVVREFVDQWQSQWHRVEKIALKVLQGNGKGPGRDNGWHRSAQPAAQVLRQTGDHLRRLNKDLERLATGMQGDNRLLEQTTVPLDDEVRRVRMLPFAEACAGLERLVRDLAQAGGKEVELRLEGGTVELDRSILEGLKDPLRHLVRNALDHGVETPAKRRQAGKLEQGRITVAAALRGSQVEVTVEDDGSGLDLEALRHQAARRRLPEPANDLDLVNLVFLPGFSTAPIISDVSGRGVGLDVVKSRVESLRGTVDLSFVPNAGTRFTLTVPLTLTTLRAVLVRAGGETFAFAGTNVQKLVRAGENELRSAGGRAMLSLGGPPLPFAHLVDLLQPRSPKAPRTEHKLPVLVICAGEKHMAFAVDEFVAEQEIVIKSLGARIRQAPLVAGATLLPSGRIALVLNAAHLVRSALRQAPAARVAKPAGPAEAARKRLLIVEDSVTTRALEKSILEAAGYEVATAVDGQAAWEFLQDHETDLIVSDVDMPNMDGFGLTAAVRASPKWRRLPVVLVTARETERDKARGIEVGADAYVVKSAFDQRNLLETIAQLL
jgi:two-component system chemotaxis sensor kinase CheA